MIIPSNGFTYKLPEYPERGTRLQFYTDGNRFTISSSSKILLQGIGAMIEGYCIRPSSEVCLLELEYRYLFDENDMFIKSMWISTRVVGSWLVE